MLAGVILVSFITAVCPVRILERAHAGVAICANTPTAYLNVGFIQHNTELASVKMGLAALVGFAFLLTKLMSSDPFLSPPVRL
jgi:hypothetical protein